MHNYVLLLLYYPDHTTSTPRSYFESLSTSGPGPSNTSYEKVSDGMQSLFKEIPRLVLHNANVITLNPTAPRATGVVCEGGVITSTSDVDVRLALRSGEYDEIDCEGRTALPGFIDAHVHFLAYASSLTAVDCSPQVVASISDITAALSERAKRTPEGEWVRGTGYDEFRLREKRHPTRWDLDPFLPSHPVKLGHRSGHGTVLNGRALALAGISIETPEPIAGFIDRDINTGEPTGLFIDLDDWLDERLGPQPRGDEMEPAARQAAEVFLSKGITSFHDASPCNSLKRWSFFQSLVSGPEPFPRATLMPGFAHLREFVEAGLGFGAGDDRLRVGHCKIVLSQAGGTLQPSPRELREAVREAASVGFPVAIHAVEEAEVEAAIEAIESVDTPGLAHRIEHASICPPSLIARLKARNVTVVTQPAFVYHSGDRYLAELPERDAANLYPLRAWLDSGLNVSASSDAPVTPPDPLLGIQAAVLRRARTGQTVSREHAVSIGDAITLHGDTASHSAGLGGEVGVVRRGALADFAVLDRDPMSVPAEEIGGIGVWVTVVGGGVG